MLSEKLRKYFCTSALGLVLYQIFSQVIICQFKCVCVCVCVCVCGIPSLCRSRSSVMVLEGTVLNEQVVASSIIILKKIKTKKICLLIVHRLNQTTQCIALHLIS